MVGSQQKWTPTSTPMASSHNPLAATVDHMGIGVGNFRCRWCISEGRIESLWVTFGIGTFSEPLCYGHWLWLRMSASPPSDSSGRASQIVLGRPADPPRQKGGPGGQWLVSGPKWSGQ